MAGKPPVKKIAIGAGVGVAAALAVFAGVKVFGHKAVPAAAETASHEGRASPGAAGEHSEQTSVPEAHAKAEPSAEARMGPAARVAQAWENLQTHLEQFQTVDEDNAQLRNENARMRVSIARLQSDCTSQITAAQTKKLSEKLDSETGQAVGRLLETIEYRPPNHLLPNQLLVLAGSYFKSKDFERTAVIMTDLVGRDLTKDFRTPTNYLLTGVAWYHLDHLKQADHFFAKALEFEASEDNQKTQAQARLWRALLSKRLGVEEDSQHWLNELVSNHPHSPEAGWVNGQSEMSRNLASPKTETPDDAASEASGAEIVSPEAAARGEGSSAHH